MRALLDQIRADDIASLETFVHETNYVDHLLPLSSDLDVDAILLHNPPLISVAAFFGAARCFRFLQISNADLSLADGASQTAAHFCVAGGSDEVFGLLDNAGADFAPASRLGMTCVLYAAKYDRFHFVRRFAAREFDLGARDAQNYNAVCHACVNGNAEMLEFLCARGVAPDYPITSSECPIHIALRNGSASLLRVFTRYAVSLARDVDGTPAIVHAAKTGNAAVLAILVAAPGCNVDAPDAIGWTALHWAASTQRLDLAQMLLDANAEVNSASASGMTPTHLARNRRFYRVAEFLESRSGKRFVERA
jgi:ankyrin repeat protein